MSTEVLLMSAVPDLGDEGDVVNVADGYARNFLLPRKLAAPVTQATRRQLAKLQGERAEVRKTQLVGARKFASKFAGVSCTIAVKTGEDDQLYGSVTTADIAQSLADQSLKVDRHAIELETAIKELGCFDVQIKLHPDVTVSVKVWVVEE